MPTTELTEIEAAWLAAFERGVALFRSGAIEALLSHLTVVPFIERLHADLMPRQRAWEDVRPALSFLQGFLLAFATDDDRIALLERLVAERPSYRPGLVALATLQLERGANAVATELLTRAMAEVYNDVHVQRLYLRAAGIDNHLDRIGDRFCNQPFTDFEILDNGDVFLCNCTWLPFPAGNVYESDWQSIWNSDVAQELRRSILDGDYSYCSPLTCPRQYDLPQRDAVPPEDEAFVRERQTTVPIPPRRLAMAYDRSCNLSCPQCRTERIMASGTQRTALDGLRDSTVLPLLRTAERVHITGSGDPIGSPHFRDVLRRLRADDYPRLQIALLTNGTLLSPKVWDQELAHLHGRVERISVSIDGATAATYNALRRGGDFDALCRNMDHLAGCHRRGEFPLLFVNLVIQEANFAEAPLLAQRCLDWGVDSLLLYKLRQWGTYPAAEYRQRDICNPQHPRHPELLEMLRQPVMQSPGVVPFELGHLVRDAVGQERAGGWRERSAPGWRHEPLTST